MIRPNKIKFIIGLGNPDEKYKLTRHNTGFLALDLLAQKYQLSWHYEKKFKAELTSIILPLPSQATVQNKLILIKPMSYMNNSGQTVRAVLSYYKTLEKKFGWLVSKNLDLSDRLTVIHDDLDIELGKYKISLASRSAGHRGVQSVIDQLKTNNFKRVRIGIKTADSIKVPGEKFILEKFSQDELAIINNLISQLISQEIIQIKISDRVE